MMVADGEGAGGARRVLVRGGETERAPSGRARAVANSPLVKAALNGGDPNWGRIVQAVGGGAARAPRRWRSTSRSRASQVCAGGAAIAYDERALARAVPRDEVEYEITLRRRSRRGDRGVLLRSRTST